MKKPIWVQKGCEKAPCRPSPPVLGPFKPRKLELKASMLSQLFVTMSGSDMPLVHSKVQKEMNVAEYDALWQAQATETVLYYHDGFLKAAKLNGG